MSFLKRLTFSLVVCALWIGHTLAQTTPLPEINDPANEPASTNTDKDLCSLQRDQPAPLGYSDSCRNFELLLGEWKNPNFGGTIVFKLQPDKTIAAYIGKVSERMLAQGYSRNMQIARGWEFGGTDAGTWKVFAKSGEVLSAKMPNREAGSTYGKAAWIQNGIIYIDRDRPGVLSLPAQLEGRISDYKNWVRSDEALTRSPSLPAPAEFCPVISNPVCGTKNSRPIVFNSICDLERSGYRPVHFARCQTSSGSNSKSPVFNFQCTHASKPACVVDLEGIKRTFSNACEAQKNNHSVLYEGDCKPSPILGSDANSMMCPTVPKPVCAEKGDQIRTFKNACEAQREKFEILSETPCR